MLTFVSREQIEMDPRKALHLVSEVLLARTITSTGFLKKIDWTGSEIALPYLGVDEKFHIDLNMVLKLPEGLEPAKAALARKYEGKIIQFVELDKGSFYIGENERAVRLPILDVVGDGPLLIREVLGPPDWAIGRRPWVFPWWDDDDAGEAKKK